MNYKTIIVSDLHLWSPDAKYKALERFLSNNKCETLILNWDIIDTRYLKVYWWRKPAYEVFLQNIQDICKKNKTKLHYLKGNHEEFLDEINAIKEIQILKDMTIESNWKTYYICHWHQFDKIEDHLKWLTYISFVLWSFLYRLNRQFNRFTWLFGIPYFSLVKEIKRIAKRIMVWWQEVFEEKLAKKCKRNKYDGIILWHLHKPENKIIWDIHYLNSWDWIESNTAIIEDLDWNFKILGYNTKRNRNK